MRQLFLEEGTLAIKEVCQPALDDHSVLVSVSYSFMSSGNGLARLINDRQRSILNKLPNKVKKIAELIANRGLNYTTLMLKDRLAGRVFNLGHSCSGVVIAAGSKVKSFRPGDLVACAGTDFANHADIVCVPENLVVGIKRESDLKAASLTGVGAIALHTIERAKLKLGQTVAVFGLEAIGLLTAKLCAAAGCQVIGIDRHPELLRQAQQAGLNGVYNLAQDNVAQIIDVLTNYAGIDCVIITPDFELKNQIQDVISIVKHKGRIVLTNSNQIDLPTEVACRKAIELDFVTPYGPGLYYHEEQITSTEQKTMGIFVNLISSDKLDLRCFTEHEYSLTNLTAGLDLIGAKQLLGLIIDYQNSAAHLSSTAPTNLFVPAKLDQQLKIGLMGASRNTRLNIMPVLSQIEDATINTVIDPDISRSMTASRVYRGAKALAGNLSAFRNDDSNVIFVSESCEIDLNDILNLLQQNKAVFVERPFIDSVENLTKLEEFLHQHPSAQLCIGYTRRYAHFIQKIKPLLDARSTPFMLQYRVNTGAISKEQRFADAWRFGGVMSYASHILDLFYFLAGSKPVSVSTEVMRTAGESSLTTDNFVTTVRFSDGSVCTLLFTTLGNPEIGKERLEIFFDSKTIVMTDWRNLTGFGVAPYFDENDQEPDLGNTMVIQEFFHRLRQNQPTLPVDELLISAKLALTVDQMVYWSAFASAITL